MALSTSHIRFNHKGPRDAKKLGGDLHGQVFILRSLFPGNQLGRRRNWL